MKKALLSNKIANSLQSAILVLAMAGLLVAIGWILLGRFGVALALGLAIYNLAFGPSLSSRAVLRAYQAQLISTFEAPELAKLFATLLERSDVPHSVDLYYVPSRVPNAFAVGTGSESAIAVSDGLLRIMNERELAGVLAHELAHIRHKDIRVMGIADTMGRIAANIARVGALLMFIGMPTYFWGDGSLGWLLGPILMVAAPLLVFLLQMALSRSREFNADMGAAEITGDPLGLASALAKLEQVQERSWLGRVLNPGQYQLEPSWLRSHPATAERIKELREVADSFQRPPSRPADEPPIPVEFHQPVLQRPRYHPRSGVWY